ncbi:hypothetical protein CBS101457_002205 [Exobasidium rhododendri]|nr:hypothetical protein CBS101457_002205 [Exobasidium rhododendri]
MKGGAGISLAIGKTKAYLINAAECPVTTFDSTSSSTNDHIPHKVYSIQTLRTQAIDLAAPRQTLQNVALQSANEEALDKDVIGSIVDVASMSRGGTDIEDGGGHDTLVILHVSGSRQNELMANVLSAPRYTRHRSEPAFTDYNYYLSQIGSQEPITSGVLREHARSRDEEALENNQEDEEGPQDGDELIIDRFLMHSFPTKICSITFSLSSSSFGRVHSGPWICIRTISSTVFATVERSSKQEKLLGFPFFRLVLLLEILHGNTVLSSGVTSKRVKGTQHLSEHDKVLKSRFPIVDVRFHPDRCTTALTVDTKGNVGSFECDALSVKEASWQKGVSWHVRYSTLSGREQETRWMLEWTENDEVIILASPDEIQSLCLQRGDRKTLYTSVGASIVSISCSFSQSPLLWVATTTEVLLFSRRLEFEFQRLLSWQHHRSHASQLQVSAVPSDTTSAVVLSNRKDRMLSVYTATVDSFTNRATTLGEAGFFPTSLSSGNTYACAPVFAQVSPLDLSWQKWIRRNSIGTKTAPSRECLMIELGQDRSVWMKVLHWSAPISAHPSRADVHTSRQTAESLPATTTTTNTTSVMDASELSGERSLHSLSSVYRVLMANWTSQEQSLHRAAVLTLSQAGRWLQEQDVALETMTLPLDILAMCHGDGSSDSARRSPLVRLPLLPMSYPVESDVQRLLASFMSATERDAWTIDLHKFISSQLCARVPSASTLGVYDIDNLSERMLKKYIPQDVGHSGLTAIASRKLAEKMHACCREIQWDILLSSRVISMRPVVVQSGAIVSEQSTELAGDAQTGKIEEKLRKDSHKPIPPPFQLAFFTPRPAKIVPSSQGTTKHDRPHKQKQMISRAARYLLSEWQVGTSPNDYIFQHPYEEDVEGGVVIDSDGDRSQSDNEQRRRRNNRSKAQQQFHSADQDAGSQRLPPMVASSLQTSIPTQIDRFSSLNNISSTVPSSFSRPRPRKRRAGGF